MSRVRYVITISQSQAIVINGNIKITCKHKYYEGRVYLGQIDLGIIAPKSVDILRSEIYNKPDETFYIE